MPSNGGDMEVINSTLILTYGTKIFVVDLNDFDNVISERDIFERNVRRICNVIQYHPGQLLMTSSYQLSEGSAVVSGYYAYNAEFMIYYE